MFLIPYAFANPLFAERVDRYTHPALWHAELRKPADPALRRFPDHPALARFITVPYRPAGPDVLRVWRASLPVPPPSDTPDFRESQLWLDDQLGIGADVALGFPGGTAATVRIADIEYGWDPAHEDLEFTPTEFSWGWYSGYYAYHGNGVLGQLRSTWNDYGVDGATEAEIIMVSPYWGENTYDVARAIAGAADLLGPGDVLLIEQQGYVNGRYCPVEADPGMFAAIEDAVARGIIVVEPGGNGGAALDEDEWEGWFDPSVQDSGAVLVGGGRSPLAVGDARTWYVGGSSYGARVDVQGWFDSIVTAANGEYGASYADLYFPEEDGTRAYTSQFGGTSGASPMVAATAAILQSVRIEQAGAPLNPRDARAALISTGLPQPADDVEFHIGPMPTLRTLLRVYGRP